MVSHVDDVLHTGNSTFEANVMDPLKESFQFGKEDQDESRYVGMKIIQNAEEIIVDYSHYIQNLEVPELQDSYGDHN